MVLLTGTISNTGVMASGSGVYCVDGTEVPQAVVDGFTSSPSQYCSDKGGVASIQGVGHFGSASDLNLPTVDAGQPQFQNILNIVFMIAGALATIFIVVGGIQYVMSIGSPDRIEKAKNSVLYAVVGLVVTILASVIVNFVVNNIL